MKHGVERELGRITMCKEQWLWQGPSAARLPACLSIHPLCCPCITCFSWSCLSAMHAAVFIARCNPQRCTLHLLHALTVLFWINTPNTGMDMAACCCLVCPGV